MGLLDGAYNTQNDITGEGELIDLGLNSKIYYDGADGSQGSGVANYGNYQFTSLEDIINSFIVAYVGEDKIISKIRRTDVAFHAQRALAELSFDTLKSVKSFESDVPPSLTMPLPQDYVHYTKVSWVDAAGIKHIIYPASKTSNPVSYQQKADGGLKYETNTWKVNIIGAYFENGALKQSFTGQPGALLINQTVDKIVTNQYVEYGITRSVDSFGNRMTSDNDFVSKTPIPRFKSEVRVTLKGVTKTINSVTSNNLQNANYGKTISQGGNASNDGMIIQLFEDPNGLSVGMTVFGPGIPDNTTITSLDGITAAETYPGKAILITNPQYQEWKLMDPANRPVRNPGKPLTTINASLYGKEIIFVDLNKESKAWSKYKSHTSVSNSNSFDDYEDDIYWPNEGGRYGLDPQHAQSNGSYYIDDASGLMHFSSNISGKTVILDYLSDSLGTDSEMKVHKFAEEAMYKCIAYAIMSTRANVQEYIVRRFQKDRFAAVRTAKLRLSNLKLEELTQILRGKSKQIKH